MSRFRSFPSLEGAYWNLRVEQDDLGAGLRVRGGSVEAGATVIGTEEEEDMAVGRKTRKERAS